MKSCTRQTQLQPNWGFLLSEQRTKEFSDVNWHTFSLAKTVTLFSCCTSGLSVSVSFFVSYPKSVYLQKKIFFLIFITTFRVSKIKSIQNKHSKRQIHLYFYINFLFRFKWPPTEPISVDRSKQIRAQKKTTAVFSIMILYRSTISQISISIVWCKYLSKNTYSEFPVGWEVANFPQRHRRQCKKLPKTPSMGQASVCVCEKCGLG